MSKISKLYLGSTLLLAPGITYAVPVTDFIDTFFIGGGVMLFIAGVVMFLIPGLFKTGVLTTLLADVLFVFRMLFPDILDSAVNSQPDWVSFIDTVPEGTVRTYAFVSALFVIAAMVGLHWSMRQFLFPKEPRYKPAPQQQPSHYQDDAPVSHRSEQPREPELSNWEQPREPRRSAAPVAQATPAVSDWEQPREPRRPVAPIAPTTPAVSNWEQPREPRRPVAPIAPTTPAVADWEPRREPRRPAAPVAPTAPAVSDWEQSREPRMMNPEKNEQPQPRREPLEPTFGRGNSFNLPDIDDDDDFGHRRTKRKSAAPVPSAPQKPEPPEEETPIIHFGPIER
jgi:hypothetical protein